LFLKLAGTTLVVGFFFLLIFGFTWKIRLLKITVLGLPWLTG
jgi:hypothetical protein